MAPTTGPTRVLVTAPRRRPRRALAVAAALAAALVVLAGLGAAVSPAARSGAAPGDAVTFHWTAVDADGRVRATTRDGEPARAVVRAPDDDAAPSLAPYLVGRAVGDRVATPLFAAPLGDWEDVLLVGQAGPFDVEQRVAAEHVANATRDGDVLTLPGGLRVTLLGEDGGDLIVRVHADVAQEVRLPRLPFPVVLEPEAGEARFRVTYALVEGLEFTAGPCALDLGIAPGTYVVGAREANGTFRARLLPAGTPQALAGVDLRYEVEVVGVERPGLRERVALALAPLGRLAPPTASAAPAVEATRDSLFGDPGCCDVCVSLAQRVCLDGVVEFRCNDAACECHFLCRVNAEIV